MHLPTPPALGSTQPCTPRQVRPHSHLGDIALHGIMACWPSSLSRVLLYSDRFGIGYAHIRYQMAMDALSALPFKEKEALAIWQCGSSSTS